MAYDAAFASTPRTAVATLTTANTSIVQTASNTNIITLMAAGSAGSRIDDIYIKALGTTTAGMIRLWLHDGSNNTVIMETIVSAITPSGSVSSWATSLTNLGIILASGWSIKASTHNTENFAVFVTRAGDF